MNQGLIEAFPFSTKENGKPYTFEPSSVFENSGEIYLIGDKKPPEGKPSPMIKFSETLLAGQRIENNSVQWIHSGAVRESRKIEAVTKTLDGKYTLAITAFNKPKDSFKKVLFWPSDKPESAGFLQITDRDGKSSSEDLYSQFISALKRREFPEGPGYIKIEGLSVLPDDRVLFGIREMGRSQEDYIFSFILIEAELKSSPQAMELSGPVQVVYEFDPDKKGPEGLKSPLGLSSMEYCPKRKGFFLLTSYEVGEEGKKELAAYIWFLPLSDFKLGKSPELITLKDGSPLQLDHKGEGLWILDEHRLLIIHDDDRETGAVSSQDSNTRQLNQAVFSIVRIY